MEYLNEDSPKPKTWGERLRGIGGAILDGLAQPSPYQMSLDPSYFEDTYGSSGPEETEATERALPNEQL